MADNYEVTGHPGNLINEYWDRIIGPKIFAFSNLAFRAEPGSKDLCGLLCPGLAALTDGQGTHSDALQKGSHFLHIPLTL